MVIMNCCVSSKLIQATLRWGISFRPPPNKCHPKPQGLVRLALYQKLNDSIPYGESVGYPTVAIGGIDQSNAEQVWQCGVSSLAVVRAITLSESPKQVIEFSIN